jgi:hypothetical protein
MVGGLMGFNSSGTIINSYSTGDVTGANGYVGGLVGQNYGTISNSYSTGNVEGIGDHTGGLVGLNNGPITNSYSTGKVTGMGASGEYTHTSVGGLVGSLYNNSTIINSYSTGTVTGTGTNASVGGLAGRNDGSTITNSYYDKTVNNSFDDDRNEGKSTEEMQSETFCQSLREYASYLSVNDWDCNNTNEYPTISNNAAAPILHFASGSGTETDPYIITEKEHLENLSFLVNLGTDYSDKYYKLGANIELNGSESEQWIPIGNYSNPFQGIFDGSGFEISGVYINNSNDNQGLFGLNVGGEIKNLRIIDLYVKGGSSVGGLVGLIAHNGIITNSYSIGEVSGADYVGGLVGRSSPGTITNSYSIGNVTGISTVGGLIGHNEGTIINSYFTGTVTGAENDVGGLAGGNLVQSPAATQLAM